MDQTIQQHSNSSTAEISLKDIILIAWNQRIVIAAITVLFAVVSIYISLTSPEVFVSTSKLITKTASSTPAGNLAQLAATAGISLGSQGGSNPSQFLPIIIQDKEFITKILEKKWYVQGDSLYLIDIWEMEPDTTVKNWQYIFEMSKIDRLRGDGPISLSEDRRSGLLTLTTKFGYPELAWQINMYVLQLLDEYIVNTIKVQAQEKRAFIEERISEVSKELEESENRYAQFNARNLSISAPMVYLENQRLLRRVTLNQELYIQLKKQYELARIQEKNEQPLIEVLQKPEIPVLRAEPRRKIIVVTGTMAGFLISVFISFLLNWVQVQLKNKDM